MNEPPGIVPEREGRMTRPSTERREDEAKIREGDSGEGVGREYERLFQRTPMGSCDASFSFEDAKRLSLSLAFLLARL